MKMRMEKEIIEKYRQSSRENFSAFPDRHLTIDGMVDIRGAIPTPKTNYDFLCETFSQKPLGHCAQLLKCCKGNLIGTFRE